MSRNVKRFITGGPVALVLVLGLAAPGGAYQRPGVTERLSVSSTGEEAGGECSGQQGGPNSHNSSISGDGRFVAFDSCAQNLVPSDENGARDVFVHDRSTKRTEIVSVGSGGLLTEQLPPTVTCDAGQKPTSQLPSISATGRFVAFQSCALDLVVPDANPAFPDIFVRDRKLGRTELVSKTLDGLPVVGRSTDPHISANGRFVTFTGAFGVSETAALVQHVYLHDRKTGETELIDVPVDGAGSTDSARTPLNPSSSGCSSVSADGRYVLFYSTRDNLVPDDTNLFVDVFVRDRQLEQTERVSVTSDGSQGIYSGPFVALGGGVPMVCGNNAISKSGRIVVFQSSMENLVPNDTNGGATGGAIDAFVRDRKTGRTERVSVTSAGEQLPFGNNPSVSADGRRVTFDGATFGCDYIAFVMSCISDVYLNDRLTGAQEKVSVASDGREVERGSGSLSYDSAVDDDGSAVAFISYSGDLSANDTNEASDVFVRQRGSDLGVGGLTMAGASGFASTGYLSQADSPVDVDRALAGQGADLTESRLSYRPSFNDLFVDEELQHLPSLGLGTSQVSSAAGSPAIFYGLRFAAGGKRYEVRATSLLGGTFGLFDCTGEQASACTEIADLRGGYGTTGERIVFSLPLGAVGLEHGGELSDVEAFSAIGTFSTGALKVLDLVRIAGRVPSS